MGWSTTNPDILMFNWHRHTSIHWTKAKSPACLEGALKSSTSAFVRLGWCENFDHCKVRLQCHQVEKCMHNLNRTLSSGSEWCLWDLFKLQVSFCQVGIWKRPHLWTKTSKISHEGVSKEFIAKGCCWGFLSRREILPKRCSFPNSWWTLWRHTCWLADVSNIFSNYLQFDSKFGMKMISASKLQFFWFCTLAWPALHQ